MADGLWRRMGMRQKGSKTMRRYKQIAVGLAGLLVFGTTGARENPVSLTPFAHFEQMNAPPSIPTVVMVAKENSGKQIAIKGRHALGVCEVLNLNRSSQASVFTVLDANGYFNTYNAQIDHTSATVRVLRKPRHGILEPNPDWVDARYVPNNGYLGKDSFVLEVEGNGHRVRLHYFLFVTDSDGIDAHPDCSAPHWRISGSDATLDLAFLPPPLSTVELGGTVNLEVAHLAGNAVGQTTAAITLDRTATGHSYAAI